MATRNNSNDQSPSDDELVFRWKAGSASAFEALVRRYQPRLLAFLSQRLGSPQDAEDVTQRVFVTIYRTAERFREGSGFTPWMFMIARRQAIDFRRRSGSREQTLEQLRFQAGESGIAEQSPSTGMEHQEHSQELWKWVRRHLKERAFTALWLSVQEEMDDTEVARSMKLTRTHVRVILHRARKKLLLIRSREAGSHDGIAAHGIASAKSDRSDNHLLC